MIVSLSCNLSFNGFVEEKASDSSPVSINSQPVKTINGWNIYTESSNAKSDKSKQFFAKKIFSIDQMQFECSILGNQRALEDAIQQHNIRISNNQKGESVTSAEEYQELLETVRNRREKVGKYIINIMITPVYVPSAINKKGTIEGTHWNLAPGSTFDIRIDSVWWDFETYATNKVDIDYTGLPIKQFDHILLETGYRWWWSPWTYKILHRDDNFKGCSVYDNPSVGNWSLLNQLHGPWLNNYKVRIHTDTSTNVMYHIEY